MQTTLTKHSKNRGFTLVEVAIVTPMVILIVLGILSLLIILVRNNAIQYNQASAVGGIRTALATIEKDIDNKTTFLPSTLPANFTDFNPPGQSGAYNTAFGTTAGNPMTPSTNLNSLFILASNQMVDTQIDTSGDQTTTAIKGTPVCNLATVTDPSNIIPITIIYFVNAGTLYRRTLIDNTNPTSCGPLLIKQSCPTGSDSHSPACKVKDTALLNNVTQFEVDYYANPGDPTPMPVYVVNPSPAINTATTIGVIIATTANVSGVNVVFKDSLRMTRDF